MADITGSNKRLARLRAIRKDGWTFQRRKIFLSVLADTCNVKAAALAAGKSIGSVRGLRERDGEFSQLWGRALGLDGGGDNPIDDIAEATIPGAAFDTDLAMRVLKLRGDRGARLHGGTTLTQSEVDIALLKRLDDLATR
jgi:hypothetical protein